MQTHGTPKKLEHAVLKTHFTSVKLSKVKYLIKQREIHNENEFGKTMPNKLFLYWWCVGHSIRKGRFKFNVL